MKRNNSHKKLHLYNINNKGYQLKNPIPTPLHQNLKRVIRHLDRVRLSLFGDNAMNVFRALVSYLNSSRWCQLEKKKLDEKTILVYASFRCSQDSSSIGLTLHRDTFFSAQISDPTLYSQKMLLDAIRSVCSRHGGVYMSLAEAEFCLDFYPIDHRDLNALFDALSYAVVLRHSRSGSYSCYCGEEGSITHYQGHGGNVRRTLHDLPGGVLSIDDHGRLNLKKRQGRSGKGLRVYQKEDFVRMELQLNRPSLRTLCINSLPLEADRVDVMDFIEFRKGLDEQRLSRLLKIVNRKSRFPSDEESLKRWFRKKMSRVTKVERGCSPVEYDFEDLPVALQINVFKGLKLYYGFSNQIPEFFPVDEGMIRSIKKKLKKKGG